MFEKIVLRRSEQGLALTAGDVAEALLFYQNVHLVLDYGTLTGFIKQIGMQRLLALLARQNVSAVYSEEVLGTRTDNTGSSFETHSFTAMTFSGDQTVGVLPNRKRRLEYILERHGHDKRDARKLVERFRKRVLIKTYTGDHFLPGGILNAAQADLRDPVFVTEAIRQAMTHTAGAPALLGNIRAEIVFNPLGFRLMTDLDLHRINEARSKHQPPLDPISAASLLNEILMARADTALAAHYGGDFYTSTLSSRIVRLRYGELLRRAGINSDERRQFREVVLPEFPTIREVIDSGDRSFDEFVALLDKSQRFRDWVQSVSPDEKLIQAYARDLTTEGWINSLPSKVIRYALGAVTGAMNPAVGLGLSAVDSFLLDKLHIGWRPNHFIDNRLKPFLSVTEP